MSELFNDDAERSLIGAALLDDSVPDKVAIRSDHFGSIIWRSIWESMLELKTRGQPLDLLVLSDNLQKRGAPESVMVNLSGALNSVPTAANADHYAELIRDKWLLRELSGLAGELQSGGRTGNELVALLDGRVNQLLVGRGTKLPTLDHVIDDELIALRTPVRVGLPSGVGLENVVPGGIPIDRVTTISANQEALNRLSRTLLSMLSHLQATSSWIARSKIATPSQRPAGSVAIPESPTESSQPDNGGWSVMSSLVGKPPHE